METDEEEHSIFKRSIINVSNVLSTLWLRWTIQITNGNNWFILESRSYILWNIRVLFCFLYIFIKVFKQI